MSLREITEYEMRVAGVASLPTRPTSPREFGGRGYTAAQLKEAFDRLPRLVAERYNELVGYLTDGSFLSELPYAEATTLRAHLQATESRLSYTEELLHGHTETLTEINGDLSAHDAVLAEQGSSLSSVEAHVGALDTRTTFLYHLLFGSLYACAEVEDAYRMRATAGGLELVRGVHTVVERVQGDTVAIDGCLRHAAFSGVLSTGTTMIEKSITSGEQNGIRYQLREDGTILVNGTAEGNAYICVGELKGWEVGKTYRLFGHIAENTDQNVYLYVQFRNAEGNITGETAYDRGAGAAVRVPENAAKGYAYLAVKNTTVENVMFYPIVYQPEEEDSSFSLAAPISLGKWDHIDVASARLERRTGILTVDGSEEWTMEEGVDENGNRYFLHVGAAGMLSDIAEDSPLVCTHYTAGDQGMQATVFRNAAGSVCIRDDAYDTVASWRAHLSDLTNAGTPLRIAYRRETPEEEGLEIPSTYLVWCNGAECLQPSANDACCTITQGYYILAGEEATV